MERLIVSNEELLPQVGEMLAQGATVTLNAKGNSMLPFIVGGRDSVVLQRTSHLHKGDIVLAHTDDGHYVVHRIIALSNGKVTLMGDGNLRGTEQCALEQVLGKVVSVTSNGREWDCNTLQARRKAAIWHWLRPVRRWLLWINRRLFLK